MKHYSNQGFTIVELIVAMGVFIVIVTIAVGVFVSTVRNQRSLTALMAVNNNAGSVLEQMAREMRTGYRFCGDQSGGNACDESGNEVSFTNYAGSEVRYALTATGSIVREVAGGDAESLTASETEITYLWFTVVQHGAPGGLVDDVCSPWRMTIAMGVRPRGDTDATRETKLQTTVSSRVFPAEAPGVSGVIVQTCQR